MFDCVSVLEELKRESRGEGGIRYSGVCVLVGVGEERVCMSVLKELREECREEKSIR